MDAIWTAARVREAYLRYLETLLPVRDTDIRDALTASLEQDAALVSGPFLEATPPFAAGASVRNLIDEGVLPEGLLRLDGPDGLPVDRPLYVHQEQAARRALRGRNLVVATGTGSGKTETFMLPILAKLMAGRDAGTLSNPGVRALLLYPMNALANDQMKRLRGLLAGLPEVTFGRYIGETEHTESKAREAFSQQFPGVEPPTNELLSREEMQATPPHLLITNYAMLEYLLLRPADTTLFDVNPHSWSFVVLDEAHVYNGANGIDVGMLLRRVTDRVALGRSLQFVLTSATVGGQDAGPDVAAFASNLTGAPFTYGATDDERDVVWATRRPVDDTDTWGPLPVGTYAELAVSDDPAAVLRAAAPAEVHGLPLAIAMRNEERLVRLRQMLAERPAPIDTLASDLFDGDDDPRARLGELVALGSSLVDDGTPLLSARYHLWARATEGAFVCLDPSGPHVWLTRHETCPTCNGACMEVGACKRCNATYLTGSISRDGEDRRLVPRLARDTNPNWFVLTDAAQIAALTDEDDETLEDVTAVLDDLDPAWLCTRCGRLHTTEPTKCGCGGGTFRHVLQSQRSGRSLLSCGLCGGRSTTGQIRLFESGRDAAVAVLATELYQQLPPDPTVIEPGKGRKLLLFADSRQDAAYFAPYLEGSYEQLVRRRCLLAGLQVATPQGDPADMDEVARAGRRVADDHEFFDWNTTASERLRRVSTWLQAELIPVVAANSLEGLGLMAVDLNRHPRWVLPAPLLALGLDEPAGWDVVSELLRTLRDQGVMSAPDAVDPDDDIFEPRKGPIYVRGEGPNARRRIISWMPARGVNRRLDYLRKVMRAVGQPETAAPEVLHGLWRWLTTGEVSLLSPRQHKIEGSVHVLNHELLRLRPVTDDTPVYRCATCRRVAPLSVADVCSTYGCEGRLNPWAPPPADVDVHHYRTLARGLSPIPLTVREHTAQWAPREAARIQQDFLDGRVNALSCSTTFELGVDVGELEAVILRNVPPRTANYLQRAGRAGRRAASAALVLTYAQQRSHDLTFFSDPHSMIAGIVQPPHVTMTNDRIAERHAYSVALAAFLRSDVDHAITPRSMGQFFGADGGDAAVERFTAWLRDLPPEVREAVARVVPESLHASLELGSDGWVDRMRALLDDTTVRFRTEVDEYEVMEQEASIAGRHGIAAMFQRVRRTVWSRNLLSSLGSHNLLPKYGFPVDSVELATGHVPVKEAGQLALDRDLSLAISDYAPGAEIVAGGWLWKSAGVARMPNRDLESRHFASCDCGWYREEIGGFAVEVCQGCGRSGKQAPKVRRYAVPEFGFVAEKTDKPKRPTKRPSRSYAGKVYVAEPLSGGDPEVLQLPSGSVEVLAGERHRLVVVNSGPDNAGFLLCDWCGAGHAVAGKRQKTHHNPRTGRECSGPLSMLSLAHRFQTDVLVLRLIGPVGNVSEDVWWSTLYAILEAASTTLEISRDDLDGTLQVADGQSQLVLFDSVPGGAGHVSRVRAHLEQVLQAAHRRVADCECGRETSCYRCLRGFRNQWRHDALRRGPVADLFERLLGNTSGRPEPMWAAVAGESLHQLDGRAVRATYRGELLEGMLSVEAIGDQIVTVLLDTGSDTFEGPPEAFELQAVTR